MPDTPKDEALSKQLDGQSPFDLGCKRCATPKGKGLGDGVWFQHPVYPRRRCKIWSFSRRSNVANMGKA